MSEVNTRIKILHVIHGLVPGGIETWLINVLREYDRDRFQMDILVSNPEPCFYDDEARRLGATIHYCPAPKKPWIYGRALTKILRGAHYDVVHAHLDHYSGFVLRIAKYAGVPGRIAQSHTDTSRAQSEAGPFRHMYLHGMKRWLRNCATVGLAVSAEAGSSLFPGWGKDDRWRLLYCGIDTNAFHQPAAANARGRMGIANDSIVVGHVGGFREPKNHGLIVDIAAAVAKREQRFRLVLVGDGPLRSQIEEKVRRAGLKKTVILTGYRSNPQELMRDVFNVFLFPSLWEGLPLAVLEAQAAGLACVISDRITREVDVIEPLIRRLSVNQSPEEWADAIVAAANQAAPSGLCPLAVIEASSFSMRSSVNALQAIYAAR